MADLDCLCEPHLISTNMLPIYGCLNIGGGTDLTSIAEKGRAIARKPYIGWSSNLKIQLVEPKSPLPPNLSKFEDGGGLKSHFCLGMLGRGVILRGIT